MNTVKSANDKLDELFKSSTYDDNTQAAITYFVGNKDRLKYLLTAYKIKERYRIIVNHLNTQFGNCNENMLIPILANHGIHAQISDYWFNRISLFMVIPVYMVLLIYLFQIIGPTAVLVCVFLAIVTKIIICSIISIIVECSFKPLFMKREYRKMGTPKSKLI